MSWICCDQASGGLCRAGPGDSAPLRISSSRLPELSTSGSGAGRRRRGAGRGLAGRPCQQVLMALPADPAAAARSGTKIPDGNPRCDSNCMRMGASGPGNSSWGRMRASTSSKLSRSTATGLRPRRRGSAAMARFARPEKSPSSTMRNGVSEEGVSSRFSVPGLTSRWAETYSRRSIGVLFRYRITSFAAAFKLRGGESRQPAAVEDVYFDVPN